ncbi:MAG: DUF1543 domain-containing protein [Bdellovibrionales bacterium]|jgi:hypothetical protein|nr:DUF1543 domain-containing protein [Bdellovibrionales bacterium]
MTQPLKLFAFVIGGATENSLIELHDVRICAGATMQDTYAEIRASWWGTPQSLHLDCWGELTSADGHDIALSDTPSGAAEKLWFVNLGGYVPDDFAEQHKNVFVVAASETKAKVRALKQVQNWKSAHEDYSYDVEKMTNVSDMLARRGLYIHLQKTDNPRSFVFEYGYNREIENTLS